jgi:AraC-like DNA-binding protein
MPTPSGKMPGTESGDHIFTYMPWRPENYLRIFFSIILCLPMRSLIIRDDHLESGFLSLSKQLGSPAIEHTVHLPQEWGTGVVQGILLEEGLFLRYAQICCSEPTEIIRPSRQPESETIFSLCYLLSPSSLQFLQTGTGLPIAAGETNIFFSTNNMRFSLQLPEGVPCQFVEILMEWDWLQQHVTGMEEKIRSIEFALVEDPASFLADKTRPGDERLLGEIETELGRPRINGLSLRGRLLLLLSSTIARWPAPGDIQPSIRKTWHMQTIRRVEERLVHSLEDMLPPQKQLAREFALSESTLKRHFKAVYGKTMYEYYLEKKMELAKWLIQEKKISVTETAYMLGYEKVSAFISMFKKVHKALPGSFKETPIKPLLNN